VRKGIKRDGRAYWNNVGIAADGVVVWPIPSEFEEPHRKGGPAMISASGDQAWCRDGLLDRGEGSAMNAVNGPWPGFAIQAGPGTAMLRRIMWPPPWRLDGNELDDDPRGGETWE
jgi:hypothetical protein